MLIEERTRLYETLIRVNPDLSVGASYRTIYEKLNDGVAVVALEGTPQPLNDQAALVSILGEATHSALISNAKLTASVAEQAATIDAQAQALVSAQVLNADLTAQLQAAQAEVERLTDLLNAPSPDLGEAPEIVEVHPD
jgi:hypothetical protein